jgi:hypothetical protein
MGNLAAMNGQYYCKPHFKELFRLKGNYSEGFGAEDPKKNWQPKTEESHHQTAPVPTGRVSVAAGRFSTAQRISTNSNIVSTTVSESPNLQERLQRYAATAAATNAEKGVPFVPASRRSTTNTESARASVNVRDSNFVSVSVRASVAQRESMAAREELAQAQANILRRESTAQSSTEREEARLYRHTSLKGSVYRNRLSVTQQAPGVNAQLVVPEQTAQPRPSEVVVSETTTISEPEDVVADLVEQDGQFSAQVEENYASAEPLRSPVDEDFQGHPEQSFEDPVETD